MLEEDFYKQRTLSDSIKEDSPTPPIPSKIGPYKIEGLLSRGGMSLLYLGTQGGSPDPLVIKVLSPKYLKNPETVARFLKEAHIIGLASHPNIVRLYGQGQWEKGLYIAMEFIQGVSLRQFIQQKSLSQKRALDIVLQVAYALLHLHTHGVIHRDLKPENILITETGEVKIIDFGIAQLQGDEKRPEGFMGTPVYMSPEQKEQPPRVFYSSDIYALGIIAYELILGRLSQGIIHLALLPKHLQKIIEKTLQIDEKKRYQDIVDFITDIAQYSKSHAVEATASEEELSDEIVSMIQEIRSILIPKIAPHIPPLEIGIAVPKGTLFSSLYLDFFALPDRRLIVVLAEPTHNTSPIYSMGLRGMVRMGIEQHFQNDKKDPHPLKMLHSLNRSLHFDAMKTTFSFSFLLLNFEKDQLTFVSCSAHPLLHIPEESAAIRTLSTPNPPLGESPTISLLETIDGWETGDLLILHAASQKEIPESFLADARLLAPQPQAELLLQKMNGKKEGLVVTISRL